MKLASYSDGTRDGHLVVVSHDLSSAVFANTQATRLQQLLDDWNFVAPQLHELYITLNHGKARHSFSFDPALCMAPLPRLGSWHWQALGDETAPGAQATQALRAGWTRPRLQLAAGDDMRGPHAELALPETRWPARVHAGLAVLTGDLALQAGPAQALEAVRLFGLYSRWELALETQGTAPDGALAPHWAPVLVTPDELGPAWTNGRLDLALQLQWLSDQGLPLGPPQGAQGSTQRWHYGQLLAWACRLRRLRAGAGLGCDWLSAELPAAAVMPAASAPAPARSSRRGAAATPEPQASGPAHAARLDVLGPHGVSIFGQLAPTWRQASAPTTSLPAPVDTGSGTSVAAAPSPPDSPANSPANEPTDSPSDSPFDSPATPARTARKTRAPRAVVTQAERTIDVA